MVDSALPPLPPADGERIDSATGLPLTDPFPDYVTCPNCGELEVEVWCYQSEAKCHQCGHVFPHIGPEFCGQRYYCRRGAGEA